MAGDTSGTAILPFASSDIATLRWQFSDVDLTVAQNDSVWTYPAEPGFPLEQNTPYTMAASLATSSMTTRHVQSLAGARGLTV